MRKRDLFWLSLSGLLLLLSVAYFFGAPRLQSVAPEPDATVAVGWAEVRLVFSHPVRLADVQRRVTFTPPTLGEWRVTGKEAVFRPSRPWPPGTRVTVQVAAGVRAAGPLPWPAATGRTWQFTVAPMQLAYLAPANGPAALYAFNLQDGASTQITALSGVLDYAVGPQGRWIYLSVRNAHYGADLYRFDRLHPEAGPSRLLDCGGDLCTDPQPAPDGHALAFTRTTPGGQSLRVWLFTLEDGQAQPLSPPDHYAQSPRWSPDGKLAYYDANREGYVVLDSQGQELGFFPNDTHEGYTWTADGLALIAVHMQPLPDIRDATGAPVIAAHLWRFNLASASIVDLSRPPEVEDASPVADPTGQWLAFARRSMKPQQWSLGRQLWLMTPEGASPHAITQSPNFHHQGFAWTPDGQQLAFVRTDQGTIAAPPEVWIYSLRDGGLTRVALNAYAPQWLP